jgi:hypothetical protein
MGEKMGTTIYKARVEDGQGSSKTGMFLSSVQGRIHRVSLTALNPRRNSVGLQRDNIR